MWSWIKIERVIIVPYNGLYGERKWAKMTLMGYGSNKLQ